MSVPSAAFSQHRLVDSREQQQENDAEHMESAVSRLESGESGAESPSGPLGCNIWDSNPGVQRLQSDRYGGRGLLSTADVRRRLSQKETDGPDMRQKRPPPKPPNQSPPSSPKLPHRNLREQQGGGSTSSPSLNRSSSHSAIILTTGAPSSALDAVNQGFRAHAHATNTGRGSHKSSSLASGAASPGLGSPVQRQSSLIRRVSPGRGSGNSSPQISGAASSRSGKRLGSASVPAAAGQRAGGRTPSVPARVDDHW